MRIAVLSDIHANIVALDAVLAHAGTVDAVWHLGDVVGYGPDILDEVRRVARHPSGGWVVHLARGASVRADAVVLAIGHRPPTDPIARRWNGPAAESGTGLAAGWGICPSGGSKAT